MPSLQNGDMVWTSADLGALLDDKDLLNYLIAHIQASAPAAYVTIFQDANACSARAQQMLRNPTGITGPRMPPPPPPGGMGPMKRKPSAKKKTSKKKTVPNKRKAPARGKKHHKR